MGDQRITEEKGKNYFFQGIALGHLLDELVVGVPLVRLWSYSETKIPIWAAGATTSDSCLDGILSDNVVFLFLAFEGVNSSECACCSFHHHC
jgi:hypothetical protein